MSLLCHFINHLLRINYCICVKDKVPVCAFRLDVLLKLYKKILKRGGGMVHNIFSSISVIIPINFSYTVCKIHVPIYLTFIFQYQLFCVT